MRRRKKKTGKQTDNHSPAARKKLRRKQTDGKTRSP